MTTISRINTTISDHTAVANTVALCLLVSGVIVGTVAMSQNGDFTKAYDNLFQPTTATLAPLTEASTAPQTSTIELSVAKSKPLAVQGQPQGIVDQLQPVQDTTGDITVTVNNLQPSANSVQLTDSNFQNAEGSIQ
ncbi:MAG: hypothetical protein ACHQT5_02070 [Candidatus Saccharimonadales bacterium]|jgi:hypothetical protein